MARLRARHAQTQALGVSDLAGPRGYSVLVADRRLSYIADALHGKKKWRFDCLGRAWICIDLSFDEL